MASRGSRGGLATTTREAADLMDAFGFDHDPARDRGGGAVGAGGGDERGYDGGRPRPRVGDGIQAMKAGLMEVADLFVVNKADRPGADRLKKEIEVVQAIRAPESASMAAAPATTESIFSVIADRESGQGPGTPSSRRVSRPDPGVGGPGSEVRRRHWARGSGAGRRARRALPVAGVTRACWTSPRRLAALEHTRRVLERAVQTAAFGRVEQEWVEEGARARWVIAEALRTRSPGGWRRRLGPAAREVATPGSNPLRPPAGRTGTASRASRIFVHGR